MESGKGLVMRTFSLPGYVAEFSKFSSLLEPGALVPLILKIKLVRELILHSFEINPFKAIRNAEFFTFATFALS